MKSNVRGLTAFIVLLGCPAFAADTGPAPAEAPAPVVHELFRKQSRVGGASVTYVRILKPDLPKRPPAPPPPEPTPEESAAAERLAEKEAVFVSVTALVYSDGPKTVTELRWREDGEGGREFVAYSNVDFRYLCQITNIETEKRIIGWFPFVSAIERAEETDKEWSSLVPKVKFTDSRPEYVVDLTEAEMTAHAAAFVGLDEILAYYEKNADRLKQDYLRREEESRRQEEELAKNPPKKPNTVIYFWPIKSRLN